jgi:hypothetical protein
MGRGNRAAIEDIFGRNFHDEEYNFFLPSSLSADVKNTWIYTSTPPYIFMA